MKSSILLPALLLAATSAFGAEPDRIVLPDNVVPEHYTVSVVPDAAKLSFTGSVSIVIDVKQATKQIALNAADLVFKRVSLKGIAKAPVVNFDTAQETALLTFASTVSVGRHELDIDYSGKINQQAAGLFALDYGTATGSKRALFTQFENSDARRFLPSWDEPGRKATFTLSATVPSDLMAISNTPIAKTVKLAGGMQRVT